MHRDSRFDTDIGQLHDSALPRRGGNAAPSCFRQQVLVDAMGSRERWRVQMVDAPASSAFRNFWATYREFYSPSFRAEIDRIVAEVGG